ncbi:hypothetical protein ACLHZY_15520 [Aeromonas media]
MNHSLSTSAIALAHQFRLGESVAATQMLPPLMQEILTKEGVLTVALMTAMLQCQERQDWLGLADYLEYELVQTLGTEDSR